jgi:hypothetical protein
MKLEKFHEMVCLRMTKNFGDVLIVLAYGVVTIYIGLALKARSVMLRRKAGHLAVYNAGRRIATLLLDINLLLS